jgi:hypothetical protein
MSPSLSGRRGLFLYPSFPAEGHPPRESDIATRRPGADTVSRVRQWRGSGFV